MEELSGQKSENLQKAFDYLRNEALNAQLAGDENASPSPLHDCARTPSTWKPLDGGGSVNIADVRWAFFLNLYWMFNNWISIFQSMIYSSECGRTRLPSGIESSSSSFSQPSALRLTLQQLMS